MAELRTAKEWGLTPAQWFDEPIFSREAMLAFEETEAEIRAVERFRETKNKPS